MAQNILSIRMDIIDFSTGQFQEYQFDRIAVYKKVDKITRCLRPSAFNRGISLYLEGPSNDCTFGPHIFELVPFVILQNAIKYSPNNSKISIKVEDHQDRITFSVTSLGPRVDEKEQYKIFDKGYRSDNAKVTGKAGSGLGLFAAKEIIEDSFNGSISVTQNSFPDLSFSPDLFWTRFDVAVPVDRYDRHAYDA